MTHADIADARRLWASVEGVELAEGDAPEEIARYLARNSALSTVAVADDGRLLGAVLCGHDGRRGFVYHLAVDAAHRGEGIGRAVMQRSLNALKAEGVKRVLLLVSVENAGGEMFWRREGWGEMSFAKPMGIDL